MSAHMSDMNLEEPDAKMFVFVNKKDVPLAIQTSQPLRVEKYPRTEFTHKDDVKNALMEEHRDRRKLEGRKAYTYRRESNTLSRYREQTTMMCDDE